MGKKDKKQPLREQLLVGEEPGYEMEVQTPLSPGVRAMAPSDMKFGESDGLTCVKQVPNSNHVIGGTNRGKIILYDINTGQTLASARDHEDDATINEVAVSKNYLVSCGDDCYAIIWQIVYSGVKASFKKLAKCRCSGSVLYAEISPDQNYMVTCSSAGIAKVWALGSGGAVGTELKKLDADEGTVTICRITPDSHTLITGHSEGDAVVWNVSSGKKVFSLVGHSQTVTDLAVTQDSSTCITSSYDSTVRVWSLNDGSETYVLDWHEAPVLDLCLDEGIDANNQYYCHVVTASEDGMAHIYDIVEGDLLVKLKPSDRRADASEDDLMAVTCTEWVEGGRKIAMGLADGSVQVFDRSNGALLYYAKPHEHYIDVVFPMDNALVTFSTEVCTTVIDSNAIIATMDGGHSGVIIDMAFSEDGRFCASLSRDLVVVWNCVNGEQVARLTGDAFPDYNEDEGGFAACCLRGTSLIVASSIGTVMGYNAVSGGTEKLWSKALDIDCEDYDEDDDDDDVNLEARADHVLVWSSKEAIVLDSKGTPKYRTKAVDLFEDEEDWFRWCTLDATAQTVLLCNCTGEGVLHHLTGGGKDIELEGHSDGVRHGVFHHMEDGTNTVITVSSDRLVILWNPKTGEKIHTLRGHKGWVTFCNVSHDGTKAVTCSVDKTAIVWDLVSGKEMFTIRAPGKVMEAYFTEDDRHVVVAADGCHGALYDAVTGERRSYMFSWTFPAKLCVFDLSAKLAAAGLANGQICFIRLDYTVERQPAASSVMHLADVPEQWAIEDARMLVRHSPQALANHVDGWTVVHDVVQKNKVSVLRELATSPSVAASFTIGTKSPMKLALEAKSKSAVEIIVDALKVAPPRMRTGLHDCWNSLCSAHPDLVVSLLNGVCLPADPSIVGTATKFHINPMDEVFARPAEASVPDETDDGLTFWEYETSRSPGSSGNGVVPVDAYFVALPGMAGQYKKIGDSAFHAIVRNEIADAFGSPAMTAVLTHKWNAFARVRFILQLLAYCVFLLIFFQFTLSYAEGYHPSDHLDKFYFWSRFIVIAVFWAFYALFEGLQILKDPIYYWLSVWNWIEVATYALIPAYLGCLAFNNVNANAIGSMCAALVWFKTLSFARGFRGTGAFVKMLFAVIQDIKFFLFILVLVVVGFSHAFFLCLVGVDGYSNVWQTSYTLFRAMVGDFDVDAYNDSNYTWLAITLFYLFTSLVVIILLNLLIAVLSDSYAKIQGNAVNEWKLEQAKIITEIESVMSSGELSNPKYFPRYIHFLAPQGMEIVSTGGGGVETQLAQMLESMNALKAVAKESQQALEDTRRDFNNRFNQLAAGVLGKKKDRKSIFSKLVETVEGGNESD